MTNRIKNDPFAPWDQDAHARELETTDVFNRLVDEGHPGDLGRKLEQLAASDNPSAVAMMREAGIESPRTPHIFHLSDGGTGKVFADATGTWHAVITVADEQLDFSGDDRDCVLVRAEQHMEKNRGPRSLTESELLRICRLAQSGDTVSAAGLYIELRLDGKDRRSEQEILVDPKYRELLNDAARAVWRFSRQDYVPDLEFEALLDRAESLKPLNLHVIDALFDKFEDQKAEHARSTRRTAQPVAPEAEQIPSQADLENLSDRDVERLRNATLRERAHEIRRFNNRIYGR